MHKLEMFGIANKPNFDNRLVILVSDFTETGCEIVACLKTIAKHHPFKIVVAIPVITCEAASEIRHEADELVFLEITSPYSAEIFYKDSSELTEVEAQRLLSSYWHKSQGPEAP